MKHLALWVLLVASIFMVGCRSDHINYSRALFEHVPEDPEILVLVRPDDLTHLAEVAAQEIDFSKLLEMPFDMDAAQITRYQKMGLEMLKQLGVPWENLETFGFMSYMEQPTVMLAGEFRKVDIEAKLTELGFKKKSTGFFEYIYGGMDLYVAADGLMMMANPMVLEEIQMLPDEKRLWNRPDFKTYRENSPLDNSLFVWSHPPERFLSGFEYRDVLGDVSLAANFRNNLTIKTVVRIKDPAKTVQLHNIVAGSVMMGKGFLANDPDFGPVLEGINVSQNNKEVVADLVVTAPQLAAIKERLKKEFNDKDMGTFDKINSFLGNFR